MVQRHGGSLHDIERFFAPEHRYFQCRVAVGYYLGFDAFNFAPHKQCDLLWYDKFGQRDAMCRLFDCRDDVTVMPQLGDDRHDIFGMLPRHHVLCAQSSLVYLFVQFIGDVRQTPIVFAHRIWRIAGQVHLLHAQPFSGSQERSDIMATAQIMADENDVSHSVSSIPANGTFPQWQTAYFTPCGQTPSNRHWSKQAGLCLNRGMSQDARRDDEVATMRRARILGLNYVDTSAIQQKVLYKEMVSTEEMMQKRVLPLQSDQSNVLFGITTTTSQQTINEFRQRFGDKRVTFAIISDVGFREYMHLYNPPKKIEYQDISFGKSDDASLAQTISTTLEQVRADDLLAYLVQQAYGLKASDIHLENQKESVRIRFRVDGVLHPIATLTREKYHQLMSSIAVAANVSTGATDAETGHINRAYTLATGEEVTVNLRVETVPTAYGQDVVMRVFTLKMELLRLENLGLSDRERVVVDDIIRHPTGMVLVVGPTGSGKTTTLYSIVNTLNSPERKIITLEDPVEYFMEGVVQIPVHGDTNAAGFAEKLRAVLRLDPDVVMVGEIRDQDTAKTALQAALTGHLVLSTFHASSTAAAITRMIDFIGVNPLFASAIHLVMAQRLVRVLDDDTKQPYQPDASLKAQLQTIINTLPPNVPRPDVNQITLYKPGSSPQKPFGYTGQTPIREQMLMTPALQQLLRQPPQMITTDLIEQKAREDGMLTMLQDGVLKALQGITTLEEVYRVVS
jgi:type II secretory ATPase GspE/PulE/Tfp pilus assembly ATPase PilB-like protein